MIFTATPLSGSFIVDPEPYTDERGWFTRYYCRKEFTAIGHTKEWVQMNHSMNYKAGTIRGMHYQLPPYKEIKLIRCIAGTILDVIIDLRKGSGTFLQWFSTELSSANKKMMYISEGFAHGFQCLTDNCELLYHHSEFYRPGAEGGIRYDDPRINISWPCQVTVISERDAGHLYLSDDFKGV